MNIDDIRKHEPCYDPAKYIPEDWQGTAIDILQIDDCPPKDRLWVVLRDEWIDDRTLRLFAVWCARQSLDSIGNPDQRSIEACNVAGLYADGEANDVELAAAREAASAAASAAWADRAAYDDMLKTIVQHGIELLKEADNENDQMPV